jgi:mannose-6-phosphate isomerase-like protein (cupin superfamily)
MRRPVFVMLLGAFLSPIAAGAAPSEAPATSTPAPADVPHYAPDAPAPSYFVKTSASFADLEKTMQGKGAHTGEILKPGPGPIEITWRHEEDFETPDVELHEGKDHIFFVTEGAATFTLGGRLVAPREISPGEWKAPKATLAKTVDVAKGDLLFIPHGVVHGRSVKGRRFTMLLLSFWPGGVQPPPTKAR